MTRDIEARRAEARERRNSLRATPPGERKTVMKKLHRTISQAEHLMEEVERLSSQASEQADKTDET